MNISLSSFEELYNLNEPFYIVQKNHFKMALLMFYVKRIESSRIVADIRRFTHLLCERLINTLKEDFVLIEKLIKQTSEENVTFMIKSL